VLRLSVKVVGREVVEVEGTFLLFLFFLSLRGRLLVVSE